MPSFMEWIIILLIVFLIILLIAQKKDLLEQIGRIENELHHLQEELRQLSFSSKPTEKESHKPIAASPDTLKQDYWESGFKKMEETAISNKLSNPPEMEPIRTSGPLKTTGPEILPTTEKKDNERDPNPPILPVIIEKPGFFERHPDLEKFIGENIISKIGIAILVLAIGFFVKFAIDNNWIGPIGRVGIGLICGGILTGLAHVLRNNYKAFSSILLGGGLAVFYFTIALAYHQYHLFSQVSAFLIMVVITLFAVLLSIFYDRQELAIISLIGGFSTPFMVSNGSDNYKALFIYLIILNTGLLAIAYHKAWRLLNLLAFLFTAILMGSWLLMLPSESPFATYGNGFIFASIFYILFFAVNIAHNIKENKKFIASDFGILLANTSLYFAAGYYLLIQMQENQYLGLYSASMGIVNLLMSFILFRNKKVDSNILYLLIGITLSFVSLTAPIQLHGHYITLFWATESVLLFWLFRKSGIRILAFSSFLVWVAMLVSLFMDWINMYEFSTVHLRILANKGFITTLYAALGSLLLMNLKKRADLSPVQQRYLFPSKRVLLVIGSLLLLLSGALEINHQFSNRYPATHLNQLYLLLYTYVFAVIFTQVGSQLKLFRTARYPAVILGACILLYLISITNIFDIQQEMLEKNQYGSHFMAHWISALLIGLIFYRIIHIFRYTLRVERTITLVTVLIGVAAVLFFSTEAYLLVNALFYSKRNPAEEIQRVYIKSCLPILWGICSFACMWLGMHFKFKVLRIFGLLLFFITLLKLFLFDIRNIPVAGKIAAFFCLGVLLLVVSFMYQRLKKIILDEEKSSS